ncbi:hypothetical protein T4D_8317 [Trichinella pseudospiralis]|uniref:Uncharacterized protein n=1 Tax=Trichinella pseudospiralis TaxID=6337 RepID=A0A0V1G1K8_TRIPS|nr:hypothetical protein T4D_8317 [Trichinella pseudospiralis]
MGSVFNVVNLSVINNTVDGSDVRKDAWIFWGTWLLPKVCRGLPFSLDTPGLTTTTQIYSPLISKTSDLLFRSLHSGPPSRIRGIIE